MGVHYMPQPENKPTPSELQIALENRAFEIQLFWQRTNYFLVLITALGIGVFTVSDNLFAVILSVLGSVSSLLWFGTNLGSKFWQESWEVEVQILAEELEIRSFKKGLDEIKRQVTKSLRDGERNKDKSVYKKWIDGLIIKKFSVSDQMIALSLVSTVLWLVILAIFCFRLFNCIV